MVNPTGWLSVTNFSNPDLLPLRYRHGLIIRFEEQLLSVADAVLAGIFLVVRVAVYEALSH